MQAGVLRCLPDCVEDPFDNATYGLPEMSRATNQVSEEEYFRKPGFLVPYLGNSVSDKRASRKSSFVLCSNGRAPRSICYTGRSLQGGKRCPFSLFSETGAESGPQAYNVY